MAILAMIPHRLDGIFSDGGFGREHHRVGAVVDGIGDIAHFGARGGWIADHGLEHLSGGDNEPAFPAGAADDGFLDPRHLFERHFDAEIAAGNHDAISHTENWLDVLPPFGLFDLGHNGNGPPAQTIAELLHVVGGANEGERDHVHAGGEGKVKIGEILLGEARGCSPGRRGG